MLMRKAQYTLIRKKGRLQNVRNQINEGNLDLSLFVSPANNPAWDTKKDVGTQYDVAYGVVYYLIKHGPNR